MFVACKREIRLHLTTNSETKEQELTLSLKLDELKKSLLGKKLSFLILSIIMFMIGI
jgi:hypothetical protein